MTGNSWEMLMLSPLQLLTSFETFEARKATFKYIDKMTFHAKYVFENLSELNRYTASLLWRDSEDHSVLSQKFC